MQLNKERIQ